jgi:hypothetical protein
MKRKLSAVIIVALALVGTALAANFALTKTAETNGTISFSYPRQAGADGYRYYAPGSVSGQTCSGTAVSRTFDPTRTTVKFSKNGSGQYCVEAVVLTPIGAGQYPATPPSPACSNGKDDDGDGRIDFPADPGCTSATDDDETDPPPPGSVTVSPSGNDAACSRGGSACQSWSRAYQIAQPGDIVNVTAGTYPGQVIQSRADTRNLTPGCTPISTSRCITFVVTGRVNINGILEVRGSSVYIKGTRNTVKAQVDSDYTINATGYADVEANSNADHPDHVVLEGIHTVSTGVFNADNVTLRNMGVGPATVFWNGNVEVCCREGSGMENKIGFGGGATFVPKDVTLDGLYIQRQNGDSTRLQPGADVHFGGLFVVTVEGLTITRSVFDRNVVYMSQIQNFSGPQAKRVVIDGNSFGCPVDWLYAGDVCDGQAAIQFDYDPGTEFTLSNNRTSNGLPSGLYGCYVGSCGGLTGVKTFGNQEFASNPEPPSLP